MNAAFLIGRDEEAAFDREMDRLAERYGEMVAFKYVGGFPPFNFVNLVIQVSQGGHDGAEERSSRRNPLRR